MHSAGGVGCQTWSFSRVQWSMWGPQSTFLLPAVGSRGLPLRLGVAGTALHGCLGPYWGPRDLQAHLIARGLRLPGRGGRAPEDVCEVTGLAVPPGCQRFDNHLALFFKGNVDLFSCFAFKSDQYSRIAKCSKFLSFSDSLFVNPSVVCKTI